MRCGSAARAGPATSGPGAFVKDYVAWGAGPRGSQYLVLAAKARALLEGRTAPTIEDVRASAMPVLRHRIIANHRAVGDGVSAGGDRRPPAARGRRMSPAAARRFLDLRALAALSRLRFAPRHRIEGSYSGKHQSRAQGGAGEFVDYREYAAGEDLRRLDWKVLARTGRAYLRLFQDETNLVCTLVVDASDSMRFGDAPGSATAMAASSSTFSSSPRPSPT